MESKFVIYMMNLIDPCVLEGLLRHYLFIYFIEMYYNYVSPLLDIPPPNNYNFRQQLQTVFYFYYFLHQP
jgi:hypothetical protein